MPKVIEEIEVEEGQKVETEKVGEWVHLDQLVEWDQNPRFNDQAIDQIADSIKKFGFSSPIIARKADNKIIAGHTRFKAAQSLGMQFVPVRFMDLSETEAKALALADNRLGEIASWDDGLLGDVLSELKKEGVDMDILGFSQQEVDQLLGNWTDPFWDEDELNSSELNDDEIEDNGQSIIYITVAINRAKDTSDLITELLNSNNIEHTIKLK